MKTQLEIEQEIKQQRLEVMSNMMKIPNVDGTSYFKPSYLIKSILNFDSYCPLCFNEIDGFDEKTLAPSCSCGWSGNMEELLNEKNAQMMCRKAKLNKIKNS